MSQIRKLDNEVIDQIAAGEVVERPAHMVKELVENSVDAEAKVIEVIVSEGGRQVQVNDDGKGIAPDELTLALSRHATSKIQKSEDLWQLQSFGFRGEALASIAAVSHLTLSSKRQSDEVVSRVISEFGKLGPIEEVGGAPGTSIRIENLFDNVPARKKFLKSDTGEVGQIKMVVKALALAYPEVSFRLKVNGKLTFSYQAAAGRKERAEQVLNVQNLYPAEGAHRGVRAKAVFADPKNTFGNSRNIWLFAQGRWIQDRSLQAAVMDAYRGLLMHGEFPICAVWIECEPEEIDVNIHPTKSQVKFSDQRAAYRAVQAGLREAMEEAPWLKNVLGSQAPVQGYNQAPVEKTMSFSDSFTDQNLQRTQFSKKEFDLSGYGGSANNTLQERVENYSRQDLEKSISEKLETKSYYNYAPGAANTVPAPPAPAQRAYYENRNQSEHPASQVNSRWADLEVIGQANLTYIVAQTEEKVVFVDQHAAHERVAFEKLMQAWKGGQQEIQNHLLPLTVEMGEELVEALSTTTQELEKLGVSLDIVGPTTVAVRSQPVILKETAVAATLKKLAQEVIDKGGSFAMENAIAEICATMACHSVIRAGQPLSVDEMKSLLIQMDEFPLSSFCPHGRPVYVEYPFYKLEKDFGRIV